MLEIGLTTIVNNALILLASSDRIDDINGPSGLAAQARDILPLLIPDFLARHPWNFAVTRAEVSRSNADQMNGKWAWRYDLPADCLRWLPWEREDPDYFSGVEESSQLLSNHEGPILVRYIRNEQNIGKWSPLFTGVVTAEVAYQLAETVAASQSIRDRMEMRVEKGFIEARRVDGLASNQTARRRPENLSNAVRAMHGRW